ncbi:MAG: hypothetical protein VX899_00215 [Myxococcota bacterium]|nr:hypothetical protein [Myxococcota bacterium]
MLALMLPAAFAQALPTPEVAADWSRVDTAHYNLYYPQEAEAWALMSAAHLESIRAAVQAEVGAPMPEQAIDVLVQDPFSRPNGFAIPLQYGARMGIFASPPGADSVLGNYRSWHELLLVHEDTHLVHLLTPSRNPLVASLQSTVLPMGPVALKSPRWVSEGYATVVEGRLTGSGRPHSDGRATLLRSLAATGTMPTYDELDGADRFMGGSMAYLVGSAYLEWLEAGSHPGALQELWRAMSAKELRGFDDAFIAVFGDDPRAMYQRYVAELAADALAVEDLRPPQDTLWQATTGYTGAPQVSPDGSMVAFVRDDDQLVSTLVVLSTDDNAEAIAAWEANVDAALEEDPLDVRPLLEAPLPREPLHERKHWGVSAEEPAWLPDGSGLVFASWQVDHDGRMRPDLYSWTLEGQEQRITHGESLRAPDVHPSGQWIVAVQERWAISRLVWVERATGAVTALYEGEQLEVVDSPRVSPDGLHVAFLRHRGTWELVILDLRDASEVTVALPEGAQIAAPEWADNDSVVASVGLEGFVEAWDLPVDGSPGRRLTQTRGGALHPCPDGQGGLYFLSLGSEGLSLHHSPEGMTLSVWGEPRLLPDPPRESFEAPLVLRIPESPQPQFAAQEVSPRDYGLGPHSVRPLVGASVHRGGGFYELGLRAGDPAGRSTVHALAGFQEVRGASGAWTVRMLPVDLGLWAWTLPGSSGAALVAQDSLPWAHGIAEGGASLRADTAGSAAAAWGSVAHTHWFGVGWVSGSLDARGQLAKGGSTGLATAHLAGGLGLLGLRVGAGSARGEDLMLGGLDSSLYAPGWDTTRIYDPSFLSGSYQASRSDHWEAAVGIPGGLWLETRWRTLDDAERVGTVGLRTDITTPRQPFMRSSQADIQAGVSCILDPIGDPVGTQAFTDRDSYQLWLGLRWTP